MFGVERFGDEIVSTLLHRLHCVFDCPVGSHYDYGGIGIDFFCLGQYVESVHIRHAQIGQNQVVRFVSYQVYCLSSIACCIHPVALFRQGFKQHVSHRVFVISKMP